MSNLYFTGVFGVWAKSDVDSIKSMATQQRGNEYFIDLD
jgi:hypothetical protein